MSNQGFGSYSKQKADAIDLTALKPIKKEKGKVTLADVANELGVSINLLSLVNTGSGVGKYKVGEELRSKILEAEKILGYKKYVEPRETYYYNTAFKSREEMINAIKHFREEGYTNDEIAEKTGLCDVTVWKHIGPQPEWITDMKRAIRVESEKIRKGCIVRNKANEEMEEYNKQVALYNERYAEMMKLQNELQVMRNEIEMPRFAQYSTIKMETIAGD